MQILWLRDLSSVVAVLLLAAVHLGAQDTTTARPRTGRILGVFDAERSQPIEAADVIDRLGGGTARTQRSGLVGLAAFANQHDSSIVTIRKIGFVDTTILVMTGPRDTVPTQVFLRRTSVLDTMTIVANEVDRLPFYLKDFEDRLKDAKVSGAKTFTPSELRKVDGRRLYDVLRTKSIGQRNARCGRIAILVNGVPYAPLNVAEGSAGIPDDDVDNYEAVVYYTMAELPMELRRTLPPAPSMGEPIAGRIRASNVPCGALLLYPRVR